MTASPAGSHRLDLATRFAEVAAEAKTRISHRSRAFRALAAALDARPWELDD